MFKLLTNSISQEQQNQILSQSLTRGTKGLEASDPFYQLPIAQILDAALCKVLSYQNSFAAKRSDIPTATIWCDRFAELAIFLRGLVSDNAALETKLLSTYPYLSRQELQQQSGGIFYGYWILAARVEDNQGINEQTLQSLIELARDLIPTHEREPEPELPTFAQELTNYTKAKVGRSRKPTCALTGAAASTIRSSGMPYKTQVYGNKRTLGTRDQYTCYSPEIQQELALRLVLFGKDKEQQKLWIYANQNIKTVQGINVPMDFDYPYQAITKTLKLVEQGITVLVSPSLIPEEIETDYCIQTPPFWMQILNCKSSGSAADAKLTIDVMRVLLALNRATSIPNLGNGTNMEKSLNHHAREIASNILHIHHTLNSTATPTYIKSCLDTIKSALEQN